MLHTAERVGRRQRWYS